MKKSKKTLSHLPSAFIREALVDLVKCERSKKYDINMANWHYPGEGSCSVCLAGSVMAQTLQADPLEALSPSDMNPYPISFLTKTEVQLRSLNRFREGSVTGAFEKLTNVKTYNKPRYRKYILFSRLDREIVDYAVDKTKFKRQMRKLAGDLEKAGY